MNLVVHICKCSGWAQIVWKCQIHSLRWDGTTSIPKDNNWFGCISHWWPLPVSDRWQKPFHRFSIVSMQSIANPPCWWSKPSRRDYWHMILNIFVGYINSVICILNSTYRRTCDIPALGVLPTLPTPMICTLFISMYVGWHYMPLASKVKDNLEKNKPQKNLQWELANMGLGTRSSDLKSYL